MPRFKYSSNPSHPTDTPTMAARNAKIAKKIPSVYYRKVIDSEGNMHYRREYPTRRVENANIIWLQRVLGKIDPEDRWEGNDRFGEMVGNRARGEGEGYGGEEEKEMVMEKKKEEEVWTVGMIGWKDDEEEDGGEGRKAGMSSRKGEVEEVEDIPVWLKMRLENTE